MIFKGKTIVITYNVNFSTNKIWCKNKVCKKTCWHTYSYNTIVMFKLKWWATLVMFLAKYENHSSKKKPNCFAFSSFSIISAFLHRYFFLILDTYNNPTLVVLCKKKIIWKYQFTCYSTLNMEIHLVGHICPENNCMEW